MLNQPTADLEVDTGGVPRSTTDLIGRILLASIFLVSGIAKLTDTDHTAGYMTSVGIPSAHALALVAGTAEILGGVAILLGVLTRAGAAGLFLFMVPTTLLFHHFWDLEGADQKTQMVNFMKNLAIMGGLAELVAHGAGRFSIDAWLQRRRIRRAY
jgi:putative oxidoreductase